MFRFPTLEEVATITWDALQQLKVLIHRESLLKAKLLCKHFIKIKDNSICLHLRLRLRLFLRLFLRLRLRLCLFYLLRILLKQNTALLSHVCQSVSHKRDISSFLNYLIV